MIQSEVKKITPEMAQAYLKRNGYRGTNRVLSQSTIRKYARMMERGEWRVNGEPIIFDRGGYLLNGQHRLHAIIACGIPTEVMVVTGVEESAFTTMDRGKSRSFADVLSTRGIENNTVLAAAARLYWSVLQGFPFTACTGGATPSPDELLEVLQKHPLLYTSAAIVTEYAAGNPRVMNTGLAACIHYLLAEIDSADANVFFRRLLVGDELQANSPVYELRARLMQPRGPAKKAMNDRERAALTVKTWNLVRSGQPAKVLMFRRFGKGREPFPVAI